MNIIQRTPLHASLLNGAAPSMCVCLFVWLCLPTAEQHKHLRYDFLIKDERKLNYFIKNNPIFILRFAFFDFRLLFDGCRYEEIVECWLEGFCICRMTGMTHMLVLVRILWQRIHQWNSLVTVCSVRSGGGSGTDWYAIRKWVNGFWFVSVIALVWWTGLCLARFEVCLNESKFSRRAARVASTHMNPSPNYDSPRMCLRSRQCHSHDEDPHHGVFEKKKLSPKYQFQAIKLLIITTWKATMAWQHSKPYPIWDKFENYNIRFHQLSFIIRSKCTVNASWNNGMECLCVEPRHLNVDKPFEAIFK